MDQACAGQVPGPGAPRGGGRRQAHVVRRRGRARLRRRRRGDRPRRRQGPRRRGALRVDQEQIHRGAFDSEARLEVMDESGICAQVCFPNSIGLGGQGISDMVKDPELRLLCVQIYNDASAEVQAESGDRLLPMPVLPAWDVDAAVAEAERVAVLGLRGVNMTSDPQDLGAPDLANRAWDPLWEVCADLHTAGALPHRGQPDHHDLLRHLPLGVPGRGHQAGHRRDAALHRQRPGGDQHHLERHARPSPRAQDGLGGERRRLDPLHPRGPGLRDVRERAQQLEALSMLPSEYFKRKLYATFWFEKNNLPALDRHGRARTTSSSRPTSPTRRACTPSPSTRWPRRCRRSPRRCNARSWGERRSSTASAPPRGGGSGRPDGSDRGDCRPRPGDPRRRSPGHLRPRARLRAGRQPARRGRRCPTLHRGGHVHRLRDARRGRGAGQPEPGADPRSPRRSTRPATTARPPTPSGATWPRWTATVPRARPGASRTTSSATREPRHSWCGTSGTSTPMPRGREGWRIAERILRVDLITDEPLRAG